MVIAEPPFCVCEILAFWLRNRLFWLRDRLFLVAEERGNLVAEVSTYGFGIGIYSQTALELNGDLNSCEKRPLFPPDLLAPPVSGLCFDACFPFFLFFPQDKGSVPS